MLLDCFRNLNKGNYEKFIKSNVVLHITIDIYKCIRK